MAAIPDDTKWAETGMPKIDIKEEPHEPGYAENIEKVSTTKRPSLEDFICAVNIVKKEPASPIKNSANHIPMEANSPSNFTIRTKDTSMLIEPSLATESVRGVPDSLAEPEMEGKGKEVSSLADAATSLVVLSMHQSLNVESLGYSVIENDASERDNYISKDDLTKLADVPEKYSTLGVGHQITCGDGEGSEVGGSDAEHFPEDENMKEGKGRRPRCRVCRRVFENEEQLEEHARLPQAGGRVYKCCACGKTFRDGSQLNVHTRTHTGEQPYECGQCGRRFSINGNLSKHMRLHTGERRFHCHLCDKKFTQFAHLEDHVKTHSGDKPYQCDVCLSAFKTKARLKKHVKCHQEERATRRSVRCPVCDRVMKTMRQLIEHVRSHGDGEGPHRCAACGKTYRTHFYLQCHQRLHSGVRAFQCSLCDKAFATSSQLRRHVNSHAGIKPFTCELCDKSFPSTQNLKRHILTHTGIKPYSCDVCSKGFLTLENLNRHMRTHTGEKPYSCDLCGKRFAHSTTVKEHRHTHTGDKPYGCSICGRRFTASKLLFKHIRQRHPEYNDHFERINSMPPNTLMRRTALAQMQQEYFQMMAAQQRQLDQLQPQSPGGDVGDEVVEAGGEAVKPEPMDTDDEEDVNEGDTEVAAKSSEGEGEPPERNIALNGGEMVKVKQEKEEVPDDADGQPLPCDICRKSFASVRQLQRHRRLHDGPTRRQQRPAAPEGPAGQTERHETRGDTALADQKYSGNSRSPGRPFKCSTCAKQFTSERRAKNHVMLKHGGKGEIVETAASTVLVHEVRPPAGGGTGDAAPTPRLTVKVEEGVKEETVDVYPDPSSLTPYPCEVCFRNFATPDTLREHQGEAHAEGRPFRCDECGEGFAHAASLGEHRWQHTGDSPFQCSLCGQPFVSTHLLQDHLRSRHLAHYELFKVRRGGRGKGDVEAAGAMEEDLGEGTAGGMKVEAAGDVGC